MLELSYLIFFAYCLNIGIIASFNVKLKSIISFSVWRIKWLSGTTKVINDGIFLRNSLIFSFSSIESIGFALIWISNIVIYKQVPYLFKLRYKKISSYSKFWIKIVCHKFCISWMPKLYKFYKYPSRNFELSS